MHLQSGSGICFLCLGTAGESWLSGVPTGEPGSNIGTPFRISIAAVCPTFNHAVELCAFKDFSL